LLEKLHLESQGRNSAQSPFFYPCLENKSAT